MRRRYAPVIGAMALLIASGCTDKTSITDVARGLKPHASSKDAVFTTVNPVDGDGHCHNSTGTINCNLYDGKQYVWLSGGPATAYEGAGNYFFAVLQPGGQKDPNDGTARNLSDQTLAPLTSGAASGDSYLNRVFSIDAAGVIAYTGSHGFSNNEIRLMPYDDTPNPGGVYIMAICKVGDIATDGAGHVTAVTSGYPVTPSDCKYDAFKIVSSECVPTAENNFCGGGADAEVQIHKTLTTDRTRTYTWSIDKSSDVGAIQLAPGQSTTLHYTVSVGNSFVSGADVFTYKGTVTVVNAGLTDAHHVAFNDSNSDITLACKLASDGSTVTSPIAVLAVGDEVDCTYGTITAASDGPVSNTATVSWDRVGGGSPFQTQDVLTNIAFPSSPTKLIDDCVNVQDTFPGSNVTGQVCVGGANPTVFTYNRPVTAPNGTGLCGNSYNIDNTASFTTNTTHTPGHDDNRVVETIVCGCTLGYWKNNDLYTWTVAKGYVVAKGGANGGTDDYFWKGTTAIGGSYAWAPPNNYRSKSSKDTDAPQAFGTTQLTAGNGYSSLVGLGFYAALSLPGGTDFSGKAQNLLRQATAALLNATWSDGTHTMNYPLTASLIITQVNNALLTKNATTIDNLQKTLAGYNQGGTQDLNNNNSCPINSAGAWYPH